jgi:N-sulfoglucosamine sulfohydrolase
MNNKLLLISAFAGVSQLVCAQKSEPPKTNIVLVVVDDQGLDGLSCYGQTNISTPNIDKLAEEGVRFTNAFCTASTSSASRATILTGQHNHSIGHYGHMHGYNHFSTFDNVKTLPVLLAKSGYRTARTGKFHVAPESVYHFDEHIRANGRNAYEMAEKSKAFINESAQPFFLFFCPNDPHRGGGTLNLPYKPDKFGNKDRGYLGVKTIKYENEEVAVPSYLPDLTSTRTEIAQYYQSNSRLDQGIGHLVEILKKSGKFENTLIIYISDNGMAFPNAKATLYDSGMHLPCIIKEPYHSNKVKVNPNFVSWVDIAPTILDYANVNKQNKMIGESIRPFMNEKELKKNKVYASQTFHEVTMYYPMRVIRTDKYKFIYNISYRKDYSFAGDIWKSATLQEFLQSDLKKLGGREYTKHQLRDRFELYDITKDVDELNNLANDPNYSEIVESFIADLKRFQKNTKDPWFNQWEREKYSISK